MLKMQHKMFEFQEASNQLVQEQPDSREYHYTFGRTMGHHTYRCAPWMRCMEFANECLAWAKKDWDRKGAYRLAYHPEAWEVDNVGELRIILGHSKEKEIALDWPFIKAAYRVLTGGITLKNMTQSVVYQENGPTQWRPNEPIFCINIKPDPVVFRTRVGLALFMRLLRSGEWSKSPKTEFMKNPTPEEFWKQFNIPHLELGVDNVWMYPFVRQGGLDDFKVKTKALYDTIQNQVDPPKPRCADILHEEGVNAWLQILKRGNGHTYDPSYRDTEYDSEYDDDDDECDMEDCW